MYGDSEVELLDKLKTLTVDTTLSISVPITGDCRTSNELGASVNLNI